MLSAALAFALATIAAPDEPLWINLGPANESHGLTVPSIGDGENVPAEAAGSACRRIKSPGSLYLYVAVDKTLLPPGSYDLYVTVELLDERLGVVALQYDRAGGAAYAQSEEKLLTIGAGGWERRTVRLPGAGLGGRENHGADFRLNTGELAVRRIEVRTSAPEGYEPGAIDLQALDALRVELGGGMELTVGADVDAAEAALFRALGATSIETYVTWQTVEDAGEGQWDWSRWDRQVEILENAGLKWVPFLIAGPAYANPRWFRESEQSVPYVCLEHGQASKVQSLWSPHLRPWIERFLRAFAERYGDRGVIESVLLGVTGIYGESIYPAGPEGEWTADIPGRYHNHMGWWAGDPYARAAFREAMRGRYAEIEALNRAWGRQFRSFDEVEPFVPEQAPTPRARLDFVNWYLETMTDWSAWWVGATRACFPEAEIYLCTGGDGNAMLGADFSAQARAIAPYGAGIRITNEGSEYAGNFVVTREVGTACAALGTFFGYEPAGRVDANGVIARIYNATASGARQLHCYGGNLTDTVQATRNFREYAHFVAARKPVVHAAVYVPRTAWALDARWISVLHQAAGRVRDRLDIHFLDRATLGTDLAGTVTAMGLVGAPFAEVQEIERLRRWVEDGHILVGVPSEGDDLLRTPEGSDAGTRELFADEPAARGLARVTLEGDPPPAFRLAVGAADDESFLLGEWWGREPGGEWPEIAGATKRWSGGRCGFWLPVQPNRAASLRIAALLTDHSRKGPNRLWVNGVPLGGFPEPSEGTFEFAIPAEVIGDGTVVKVELEIATWRPIDYGMDDGRALGLAVREVEIRSEGYDGPAEERAAVRQGLDTDALRAHGVKRLGSGATILLPAGSEVDGVLGQVLVCAVEHPEWFAPGLTGVRVPYPEADQLYVTEVDDGVLVLNGGGRARVLGGREIAPHGIALLPPLAREP